MIGNPILRIALVLLALAAVLVPVWKITLHSPAPEEQVTASASSEQASPQGKTRLATLLLRAVPPPLHYSVSQHGIDLLGGDNGRSLLSTGECRASVNLAPGEDLVITAVWENDEPHALGIQVQTENAAPPLEKTFWSQRTLEDVLPLPEAYTP